MGPNSISPDLPEVVCFGGVLWDILPQSTNPGGAPMNVAYHVRQAGIQSAIISSIGKDELGQALKVQLDKWGILTRYCGVDSAYPTGTVIATIDHQQEAHYQILEGVAWDHIQLSEEAKSAVASCKVLVYGTLASRHMVSRNSLSELLSHACYKICDVNLRPPFYTYSILQVLLQAADLVKLSETELKTILDLAGKSFVSDEEGVLILRSLFGIKEVLLTKGVNGAHYYSEDCFYESSIVPVSVKDTIGSGDAFLAGFLVEQMKGASIQEAMWNAIALSAFVSARVGACPFYTFDEFELFKTASQASMLE